MDFHKKLLNLNIKKTFFISWDNLISGQSGISKVTQFDVSDLPCKIAGSSINETESEKLTEEIWKRLLANLPFFIRTKGTERSLKGILNCF